VGWVRVNFPFPFADPGGSAPTERYCRARGLAQRWVDAGLRVMGVTPGPGIGTYRPDATGRLTLQWTSRVPEWFGEPGSSTFFEGYERTCRQLAEDLRGLVGLWQIANELDIEQFAGPMDVPQASEFVLAGARGLKEGDPSARAGHNPAGSRQAWPLLDRLFASGQGLLDYCGVDQYYGTWQAGGPESWDGRITELHARTGAPILVNEWGFASAGAVMTEEERRLGVPNCQLRKWVHTWGAGHTLEGQAAFVRAVFDVFCAHREKMLGCFFYRWEDQERCWQCSRPDCPIETAWGLVDCQGRPKPSFGAFREGARALTSAEA